MRIKRIFLLATFFIFLAASCVPTANGTQDQVAVIHDGKTETLPVTSGQTVGQVLSTAGINLDSLDRVEPDTTTLVSDGLKIKVVRVTESYVVEETTLPFESQTIKNESMTSGQSVLIQAGQNGIQSITYRVLTEDGIEVSRTVSKTDIVQAAQPEIVMVGVQSSFRAVDIDGVIAYISSANAWVMESSTGNRRAVVTGGDLDGRVFSISPDHDWLLFSRTTDEAESGVINTLWVVNLSSIDAEPVQLTVSGEPVENVVSYADWVPGKTQTIAYSTAEYRSAAPGWQANNDLQVLKFNASGAASEHKVVVDTNAGGVYGWWGTVYFWSPDASEIAYARPDGVGLVDSKAGSLNSLIDITPYNTQGDWAWVPWVSWAKDHSFLYSVLPDLENTDNTKFDLYAFLTTNDDLIKIKENVGMFAYPAISPDYDDGNYLVAYLVASIPEESNTSRYSLWIMDRDGSNDRKLYPGEGVQGLEAQQVVWSPSSPMIAFIAQGNMMFIDPATGSTTQVTGDGLISRIDWK